nr:X-linked retinitis pigmentosa GTPase regulator-like isoform X1 [Paramormyrops kingsleyae]XP_023679735.1 X-linked retinitis pigmentosa GTPase regulator-like isoform X1 [Paramormyrops kingsleyae]
MAGGSEDDIPGSGAIFTFGKSRFADNVPSKFWFKNDKALKICCGDDHTALITGNGKLYMFGVNNWGQLGLGTKAAVNKPTCVKALKTEKVKLAACGRNHTLVYTSRGNLYVAGGNSEGQLGLGDCKERVSFERLPFFRGREAIKMLAAGCNTSAALTGEGKLFMWGDNREGQIGLGNESRALKPRDVAVGRPVTWVSCGCCHSAFVTVDGHLYTFGECGGGRLGLPPKQWDSHRVPQVVQGIPDRVTQVACGGGHTVALTERDIYSFGMGQFGQLGHGTFVFQASLPRLVDHFQKGKVRQVVCGENHSAVITDSGLLYTFGDGRHGKLGLGEETYTNQFKPTLCPRFLKYHVQSVACGGYHMLVLARPRSRSSRQVSLEEDDITEDSLGTSYSEVQEGSVTYPTVPRSMSARVRRRRREQSQEQFGLMVQTHLKSGFFRTSLPFSSRIIHLRPPSTEPATRGLQNGLSTFRPIPSRTEKVTSKDPEDTEDNEMKMKDLGGTTDKLNLDVKGVKRHDLEEGSRPPEGRLVPMGRDAGLTVQQALSPGVRHAPHPLQHRAELKQRSTQSPLCKAASDSQEDIFTARKRKQSERPGASACELDERKQLPDLGGSSETLPELRKPTEVKIKQKKGTTNWTEAQGTVKGWKEKLISVENKVVESRPSAKVKSTPVKVTSEGTRVLSHPGEGVQTPKRVPSHPGEGVQTPKRVPSHPGEGVQTPKRVLSHPGEGVQTPKRVLSHPGEGVQTPKRVLPSGVKSLKEVSENNSSCISPASKRKSSSSPNLTPDTSAVVSDACSRREGQKNSTECKEKGQKVVSEVAGRRQEGVVREQVGLVHLVTEVLAEQAESALDIERTYKISQRASRSEMLSERRADARSFWSESVKSDSFRSGKKTAVRINVLPEARGSRHKLQESSLDQNHGKTQNHESEPLADEFESSAKAESSKGSTFGEKSSSEAEHKDDCESETKSSDEESDGGFQKKHTVSRRVMITGDQEEGTDTEESETEKPESEDEEEDAEESKESETAAPESEEQSQSETEKMGEMLDGVSAEEEEDDEEDSGEEEKDKSGGEEDDEEDSDEEESVDDVEQEGNEEDENESDVGEEVEGDEEDGNESDGEEEEEGDVEESDGEEEEDGDEEESVGEEEEEGDEEESVGEEEDEEESVGEEEEEGDEEESVGEEKEDAEEEMDHGLSLSEEDKESGEEETEEETEESGGEDEGDENEKKDDEAEEGEGVEEEDSENENKSEHEEAEDEENEEKEGKVKEEMEEESTGKRKKGEERQKSRPAVAAHKSKSGRLHARGGPSAAESRSQESQRFWNNVLPQYLNLK